MTNTSRRRRPLARIARAAVSALAVFLGARAAVAGETDRLLRCVQERYGALRDLSTQFVQTSRVATLGRPRTRSGRMVFKRPGKMRWEYDPPETQLLVSDGETLWFHRPAQKQVVVQTLGAAFNRQTPLLFLFGRGDFAAEFSWAGDAPPPDAQGRVRLELVPRVESPDLTRLVLEVQAQDCRLEATELRDAFGNLTRLEFSGERVNTGVADGLFEFRAPPGTETVRP